MADNTEKLVTLSNLSDHIEEIKRILKQVRAFIDKKDDTKVDKVDGKGLSSNDYTAAEKNKLATLKNYDDSALVAQVEALEQSLNTLVGNNASEAIDNFNEILKFLTGITDTQTLEGLLANIREDMQTYLSQKVDKESGKQLSTNDYTTADKNKLAGIESGAQKNTVTGIKGNAESSYRTGNVNLTPANIGAAATSHTHAAADISDFTTKVKTLQAADILSAEPTETTTTHTVNGVSVAYQIGELVRVPDSESETGFKFYQLHAITNDKATWAEIGSGSGDVSETVTISLMSNQSASDASLVGASILVEDISNETKTLLSTIWEGTPITIKIAASTNYKVTFGSVYGYSTPDAVQYTAQVSSTRSITAYYTLLPISTITVNQTISDPASMISGDINGEAIRAIRANSHRFLGKYTSSGTMTICQLSDTDSTKFADGSAADLTGAQGDVFMRLPEFYTKATETSTDVWQIQFAFGGQPDSTWKKWGGNDLIGVYKAYHSSSKIYSRSGVTPSVKISQADFKTYARNRGTGFTIVKHQHQNIMAFLFYALYGNTNSQAICGSGANSYPKTCGATNTLGMTDTTTANGNAMSINFWGVENWWGDLYEWVDNVSVNPDSINSIFRITENNGFTRDVQGHSTRSSWLWPTKLIIGDYLDTIAKPNSASTGETTGYCDGQYIGGDSTSCIVRRSGYSNDSKGGIIHNVGNDSPNSEGPYSGCGSRLAFTGNIIEEDNPETFKSLTAIG